MDSLDTPLDSVRLPLSFQRHLASGQWMEALPIAVYCCDLDGRILQFNGRAAALWGRSPRVGDNAERFCGSFKLYRMDGSLLPHDRAPMAEVLRTGVPARDRTVVIERPDGARIVALANIEPVFDDAGTLQGALNCLLDITERTQAHEALRAKEAQQQTLLNALPAAVYTTDAAGRITFCNEAAVALAGRRPQLGSDEWCVSWRLYRPDGTPLPHDQCPMARAIKEQRAIAAAEAVGERPDGRRFPFLAYPTPLFGDDGKLVGAINMLVDITDRKQVENDREILIHELHHRVKNTLAIIQSIAAQTHRRASSPADFVASFSGRLQAVARAHGSLYENSGRGAKFGHLAREQVLLNGVENDRISFSGPEVFLNAQQALQVALILHELGTNARKHGALTVPEGKLALAWTLETEGGRSLRFHWAESGGPRVKAPAARGFGSILIEHTVRSHGGEASIRYRKSGLVCNFTLPLASNIQGDADAIIARQATRSDDSPAPSSAGGVLSGLRLLVVEDEPLIAMVIEDSLTDAGCDDVNVARSTDEAMRLIKAETFDAALLDVNLGGRPVDEIAAALAFRNTAFAFVTGYGRQSLPLAFQTAEIVGKPFQQREAVEAVARLVARRRCSVRPDQRREAG